MKTKESYLLALTITREDDCYCLNVRTSFRVPKNSKDVSSWKFSVPLEQKNRGHCLNYTYAVLQDSGRSYWEGIKKENGVFKALKRKILFSLEQILPSVEDVLSGVAPEKIGEEFFQEVKISADIQRKGISDRRFGRGYKGYSRKARNSIKIS